MQSKPEKSLESHLLLADLDGFTQEYKFHPDRKWRFDFAYIDAKIAIEVEGILYGSVGRHQRAVGFSKDCEKYNEAAIHGWMVIRVTPAQIESGQALRWIQRALERRASQ